MMVKSNNIKRGFTVNKGKHQARIEAISSPKMSYKSCKPECKYLPEVAYTFKPTM
jgi:hypothetical protein